MSDHPWPDSENVGDEQKLSMAEEFQRLQFDQQLALLEEMREAQKERTTAIVGAVCFVSFMALVGWVVYLLLN